jgi:hypothetical protein
MSSRLHPTFDNWSGGVITSMSKDRIPDTAVPQAVNTQLYNIGQGYAIFGKRSGMYKLNKDNTAIATAVVAQHFFDKGATTYHLLVLGTSGDLAKINPTTGEVTTVSAALFSALTGQFSWDTAKDLCFVVNGTDQKKTDGTAGYAFGIVAPSAADFASGDVTVTTPGTGVLPADTYDIAITYYNDNTGAESGRSETYTNVVSATNKIQVVIPSTSEVGDAQVTHIRLHIRRQGTQALMVQAIAGVTATPVTGDDPVKGWAVDSGTRTLTVDCTAVQLAAFVTLTPGVNENQPPPSDAHAIAWHKSRMFAANADYLYWTEVGKPEAFNLLDNKIPVTPADGDPIVGIMPFKDTLLIFKPTKTLALVGDDPATWQIQVLDDSTGCVALNGMGVIDNRAWFYSLTGPRMMESPGGGITDITSEFIGPNVGASYLDLTKLTQIQFVANPYETYVAWCVPEVDQTGTVRNTHMLPFNFKVNRWMSTRWDPCDIRSACMVEDASGRSWIMLADYDGWVYRFGTGTSDGVFNTTTKTSGVTTGAGVKTVSNSAASWATNEFAGLYVYVYKVSEGIVSHQRRRIVSNTATQLTIATDWDDQPYASGDPNAYQFVIGGILFDLRSGWLDPGGSFVKKRFEYVYLHLGSPDAVADFDLDIYTDNNETEPVKHRAVTFAGNSAIWDESLWDMATFAQEGSVYERIRVGHVGKNIQIRLSNITQGQRVLLYKFALQAVPRSRKLDKGSGE